MSNNLETKLVPFMGAELMAVRDNDGKMWAGVRWMCDGIGLSRNQRDNQIEKIKADSVLSKGAGNFPLPTAGGQQTVLCLNLDYVPLWLAKISITPTMERETPEVAERLIQYQLKAKDVLAAAFIRHEPTAPTPAPTISPEAALSLIQSFSAAQTAQERLFIVGVARSFGVDQRTMDLLESRLLSETAQVPAPAAARRALPPIDAARFPDLLDVLAEIGTEKSIYGVDYFCTPVSEARKVAIGMNIPFNPFLRWANENGYIRRGLDGKNSVQVRLSGSKPTRCVCLIEKAVQK